MLVITTGKQTTDQGAYTPLDEASTRLQSKGSAVFVLGIGKDVDPSELNQIAAGPKNVFTVDSFEDLNEKANEIKKGICVLGDCILWFFFFVHCYDTLGIRYQFLYFSLSLLLLKLIYCLLLGHEL